MSQQPNQYDQKKEEWKVEFDKRFPNQQTIAHGHFKKPYEEKPSNNFIKELKEQNIKRNWRNL